MSDQTPPQYYAIACVGCRASHRKCDRVLPKCGPCAKRNVECVFEPSKKRTRQQASTTTASSSQKPQKQARMDSQTHVIVTQKQPTSSPSLPSSIHSASPFNNSMIMSNSFNNTNNSNNNGVIMGNNNTISPVNIQALTSALSQNNNTTSSSDILDICFQLNSNESGDEFQQSIIAQFLWNRSIPQPVRLSNEQVEIRVNQALWFALQAVALQNLPCASDLNVESCYEPSKEIQAINMLRHKVFQFANFNTSLVKIGNDIFGLADRLKNFSREQLTEAAAQMFQSAKEMLLDPQLYEHIASNYKLSQVITHLVTYLLVKGEHIEDAELLLSAEKVYLERSAGLLETDTSIYSGTVRERLEEQQRATNILNITHIGMKTTIWFNFSPKSKDFYTMKRFKKLIKMFCKMLKFPFSSIPHLELAGMLQRQKECLTRLKDYLKEKETDMSTWVLRVLELTREMQDQLPLDSEFVFMTFWRIFVYSLHYFAVYTAIQNTASNDHNAHASFKRMLVEIAGQVSKECYGTCHIIRLGGARFTTLLSMTAKIHIEESIDCCGSTSPISQEQLLDVLTYMEMDSAVLDAVLLKVGVQAFKDLNARLKQQIDFHKRFVDHTVLQQHQLPRTANPMTEVDFNDAVDNFFDQLYHSLQQEADSNSSTAPDDSKFLMEFFNLQRQEF